MRAGSLFSINKKTVRHDLKRLCTVLMLCPLAASLSGFSTAVYALTETSTADEFGGVSSSIVPGADETALPPSEPGTDVYPGSETGDEEQNENGQEIHDRYEYGKYFFSDPDPFGNGGYYSAVLYNNSNGMPTSEANAIAQTRDGFIWVGCNGCLLRYDGTKFEEIEIDKEFGGVKSLFVDSKNRIWMGSTVEGIAVMDKDSIRYWYEPDGMPTGSIEKILEDDFGNIFFVPQKGLMKIGFDDKITEFWHKRIINKKIVDIKNGPEGCLYCVNEDNNVFTLDGEEVTDLIDPQDIYEIAEGSAKINSLLLDPDNPKKIFLGYSSYIHEYDLTDYDINRTDTDAGHMPDPDTEGVYNYRYLKDDMVISLNTTDAADHIESMELFDDMIWVCSEKGINYFSKDSDESLDLSDLPMKNNVEHIIKDFQGNYWFTSTRNGVMKLVPNRFVNEFDKRGISNKPVNVVYRYDDKIICGTDEGFVIYNSEGILKSIHFSELNGWEHLTGDFDLMEYSNGFTNSVISDSRDRLWISIGSRMIICLDDDTVDLYDLNYDMSDGMVNTLYELNDGSVCVASADGIRIIKDKEVKKVYNKKAGINSSILTVAEKSTGEILAGSEDEGIYIIADGRVRSLGIKDGLSSSTVKRIKKDRTRDIYWLITGNSIAYMTKDHKITTVSSFPYINNYDLFQNSKDEMWVLSSNGIYILPTEQLLDDNVTDPVHYTVENGLPCVATANSSSLLEENGDLYIAGSEGVVKVNIETNYVNEAAYKTVIPYIDADGQRKYPDDNGNFNLASNVRSLTIHSFVINYSLSSPVVSYRLDGFDDKDNILSSDIVFDIDYTNLHGGEYNFIVEVNDTAGNAHQTVSAMITKSKALYEEQWFWLIIIVVGVLTVIGVMMIITHFRVRKFRRKQQDSMKLVREITEAFAKVIDMKDSYTNGHSSRVAEYTVMLAEELGYDRDTTDKFYHIALLHDIGKVGVPSEVLNKPGKLTDNEFEIIKSHTSMGYGTLEGISLMPELALGAKFHHERPDGKGYPDHLKGEEIPRVAQIIAVADCFDAMYSNRPYRKRMNFEKAVSIIRDSAGTQLTQDVVDAFLRLVEKGKFRAPDDNGGGTTENIENIRGEEAGQ